LAQTFDMVFGDRGYFGMRRVISALGAAALLAAQLSVVPGIASAQDGQPAEPATPASPTLSPDVARTWGVLAALSGREWSGNAQFHRFVWTAQEQRLVWEVRSRNSESWVENAVFTLNDAGIGVRYLGRDQRLVIGQDGSAAIQFSDLSGGSLTFSQDGDRYRVQVRPIPAHYQLIAVEGWTGASLLDAAPASRTPAPRAPIIIAAAPEPAPAPRAGRSSRNAPAARPATTPTPVPPVRPPAAERRAGPGPIVIASAPPPPAAMREGPRAAPAPTPRGGAAGSREAQMLAQVETRRLQAAQEAEAERQRQQALAERARQAEEARRAEEAANSAAWGEAFGLLGAIVGGVAAGSSTNGDMTAITAGMAAGSSIAASNSEIAAAANQNFETERARYEAEQAAERELHARTIAAMNDPNNPLTQQQRRAEATRQERAETERADMERRHREEREAEEREALMAQRATEQETAQSQARDEQARADRERADRERREAEAARQRERDAEQRRQEEDERRQAAERDRQARAEEQRREQEARRQEEERRRAERDRMMRTGNASGGYSLTSGLPPLAPSSRGPGTGTTTVPMDHIGGCRASGATVRYSLGVLMGEAVVGGGLAWNGEESCSLPASTNAWVKVSWNGSYGWVSLGASPGSANGGPGYNSPGSPSWGALLCGFEGGRPTSCMDADSAKRLWTNGTVTEVRIGW